VEKEGKVEVKCLPTNLIRGALMHSFYMSSTWLKIRAVDMNSFSIESKSGKTKRIIEGNMREAHWFVSTIVEQLALRT
jgi:hypothetical protein